MAWPWWWNVLFSHTYVGAKHSATNHAAHIVQARMALKLSKSVLGISKKTLGMFNGHPKLGHMNSVVKYEISSPILAPMCKVSK